MTNIDPDINEQSYKIGVLISKVLCASLCLSLSWACEDDSSPSSDGTPAGMMGLAGVNAGDMSDAGESSEEAGEESQAGEGGVAGEGVVAGEGGVAGEGVAGEQSPRVAEFGRASERQIKTVARRSDGLSHPRDLEFNPEAPDQLWIVDRDWDGNVVLFEAGTESQRTERLRDVAASHFMEEVSSIAFSDQRSFATCQESRNGYDRAVLFPDDFMGPVLWSTDLMIHCAVNQELVPGGLNGSHLDMLHQSPLCMGIAHRAQHIFFVADGGNGHIVRYDFQEPHVPGGDDHSDGRVSRYPELAFTRVPDIPSHLEIIGDELYYLDTGAGTLRVADLTTGEAVEDLIPENEPLELFNVIEGVTHRNLIEGLEAPSGLAITPERIFISLPKTGEIIAFDREGAELERLTTGQPGVMGLTIDQAGRLWFVNAYAGTVNWVNPVGGEIAEPTPPTPPEREGCVYPLWSDTPGIGQVMPPFAWSASRRSGRNVGELSALDMFCDPSWEEVKTLIFVVVPEWIPWLSEYVLYIDTLTPQIEAAGGRVIYVGAQTLIGEPLDLTTTDDLLNQMTPEASGERVAELDNTFDYSLVDTPLVQHLPAAFMVRREDMTVIATQRGRDLNHLPYVEITQDPEADWSDPGTPTIVPRLPSNCAPDEEEDAEPNNHPDEATVIGIGSTRGGVCERVGDFYLVDVPGRWRLDLEFSHAVGDLDLVIFNGDQPRIGFNGYPVGSSSSEDIETFNGSGPQVVYVYGFEGATAPYEIRVSAR